MIAPKVQQHGDVALLTFNLINYGRLGDGPETVLARWNSTEVYTRTGGQWSLPLLSTPKASAGQKPL
jgi:hypothetical protein